MRSALTTALVIGAGLIQLIGERETVQHSPEPPLAAAGPPMRSGQLVTKPGDEAPKVVDAPQPVALDTPIVLTPEVVLMFDTDAECVFTSSKLGFVKIEKESGPVKVRARFAQNPTKLETRNYKGKHVYTIEPVKDGECELLAWVIGEKDENKIQRIAITCGKGPRPPPIPPGPEPPTPGKEFRVVFVRESSPTIKPTADQLNAWDSIPIRKYLDEKCGKDGYRFWDKDINTSKEKPVWQDIWKAVKPTLTGGYEMIIFQGTKGDSFPLKNEADALSILKRYGG